MKKKLIPLLCASLLAGALAGCGQTQGSAGQSAASGSTEQSAAQESTQETETAESAEEPYEVRMLVPIPALPPNEDELARVLEKVNEITLEKINMTLDLEIMPFATFFEQVPLELSSGSDIDLLATYSSYGPSWIQAGYLVDMSELLPEYGQDIINSYTSPEFATAASLDGFVFGVPVHKEIAEQGVVFFRTDILEKYNIDVSQIHSLADVDAVFAQVAEQEPEMWMVSLGNTGMPDMEMLDYICGLQDFVIPDPTESTEVTTLFQTDSFKTWCDYTHKWYENGWINQGAASDTESYYTYIASGQAFAFFSDSGHPLSEADQEKNCGGVDLTMVPIGEPLASTSSATIFMYTITSGSEQPEKAMQMLNLLMSDSELMNLLNWGVEGEDYIVNEDGLLDYPEGKGEGDVGYHLGAGWVLPNQFICTPWVTDGADIYEKMIAYNESANISKAFGFVFDVSNVMDEAIATNTVRTKYMGALVTGSVDPEEYIPMLNEEMEEAGADRIREEVQRQLDEYLAAKE